MRTEHRSYARFVLLLILLAGLLGIPGLMVTRRLGGEEAVVGMVAGGGLSLLAAILGGLPLLAGRWSPREAGTFVLSALAIRMGVTLLGVLAILLGTQIPRSAFLLWVAAGYLVFLTADIVFVVANS